MPLSSEAAGGHSGFRESPKEPSLSSELFVSLGDIVFLWKKWIMGLPVVFIAEKTSFSL